MSSKSFDVNQLLETAYVSVGGPDNGSDNKLAPKHNMKLEALARKIAWVFASIMVLLMVVSLILVVTGYAASRLALH